MKTNAIELTQKHIVYLMVNTERMYEFISCDCNSDSTCRKNEKTQR